MIIYKNIQTDIIHILKLIYLEMPLNKFILNI